MKFYSNTPIGNNIPRMRVNKHKNNIMTKTKFYLFIHWVNSPYYHWLSNMLLHG